MFDDHLAGKEMEIGRWYLRNNQHLSALNRFRNVVRDYDTTLHAEEALHRLVETYLSLGLRHEAVSAAAVLGYNYPQSEWYADSYSLLQGEGLNPDDLSESGRLEWIRGLVPNFN
ncbi:MAG: outer membrane protein assembly factor BamD, partial [Henriciella sp.]